MYILLGFSDELEAQNLINKYHELNMCVLLLNSPKHLNINFVE